MIHVSTDKPSQLAYAYTNNCTVLRKAVNTFIYQNSAVVPYGYSYTPADTALTRFASCSWTCPGHIIRTRTDMEDQCFHFNTTIENLLFKNWSTQWSWGFILTFLFFLFLAILLEALAHLELLLTRHYESNPLTWSWHSQKFVNNSLLAPLRIPSSLRKIKYRRLRIHIARSLMHVPRVILGYFLMLAVMTYNAYMFIAIVIGSAIGYFLFSNLEYQRLSNKYNRKDLMVSSNAGDDDAEPDSAVHQ